MYFFYGDVLFKEKSSILDAPVEHILHTKHAKKGLLRCFAFVHAPPAQLNKILCYCPFITLRRTNDHTPKYV